MAVEHRHDEHALFLDEVDETVRPDDQLAIPRQLRVRQPMPAMGKGLQRLGCINRKLGQAASVRLGVFRDEGDCGL